MTDIVADGTGKGYKAQVFSNNKLAVNAVEKTEVQYAAENERAWNINTGWISNISSNTALIYLYNNETTAFSIDNIAIGLKNGSATDVQSIYAIENPTGGTLYDAATLCDMIKNRYIGSGIGFSSDSVAYKATADGQTLTGGNDMALFAVNDQGRLFASVDFVLPRYKAFGLRVEVGGSFSGDIYAAIVGHLKEDIA
jgi:hypothetical protein